ncbi:MAG: hypothetical protein OXH11_18845 [Candidatus Aminicenantes bacterium]|nr:hypothetical protein [Candidatus Aminicenantes bacterium]
MENTGRDHNQLASFHDTISRQLNARLEESPRFFWALIVVSTGYGYVIWEIANGPQPTESPLRTVFILASLLAFSAVIWASWYLAALGYAFRYLQNVQHCIEHALGWEIYGPKSGSLPPRICGCSGVFSLLPGIYHAHIFGLITFQVLINSAFSYYIWQWCGICIALLLFLISNVIGVGFHFLINRHYVRRFSEKWNDPKSIPSHGDSETCNQPQTTTNTGK